MIKGTISTTSQHFVGIKYEIHLLNKYFHRQKTILNVGDIFLSSSHELWAGHHEVPAVVQVLVAGRLDQHSHGVVIFSAGHQPEPNVERGE